jgi:flagellar motility protein MotE (MotC chaperone)
VDCTGAGKSLCDANEIRGYPMLKYGDPTSLDDYQGGRSFDELSQFAKDSLKPVCSPTNLDLCDADKKKQIEEYLLLSADDLNSEIAAAQQTIDNVENEFKDTVQRIQEEFKRLSTHKDEVIQDAKNAGLGLMKTVKTFKAKADKAKEEL